MTVGGVKDSIGGTVGSSLESRAHGANSRLSRIKEALPAIVVDTSASCYCGIGGRVSNEALKVLLSGGVVVGVLCSLAR